MIIVVAGPAGSGKSTLGLQLARLLRVPFLDLDTLTNPLLDQLTQAVLDGRHWNHPELRDIIRPARYAALLAAVADQVRAHSGAVVVAPFTLELKGGPEWDRLVSASGGPPHVVWLRAAGELLAERRGVRGVDRDAYIVDASGGAAPSVPHLAVDASLSIAQQLAAVSRSLSVGRRLPADSPMFRRRFAAGLFDLDGTLIDSTPAINRSWLQLAREFDVELDPLGIGHGQPAAQVVAALFPQHLAEQALARFAEIEAEELDDVVALQGAQNLLERLPEEAKAIVTSGTRLIATNRLRVAGVTPPSVLVTFDDVTKGKPDPEPFVLAAQRLGVDPADCIVFEDAPAGLAAARAAGCTTVSIVGTHEEHELQADLVVDGLYQLSIDVLPDGGFRLTPARPISDGEQPSPGGRR
jgi:sugar-phosphatase